MNYQPPFKLTNALLTRTAEIAELIGYWKAANAQTLLPQLRRGNRIRTIQASLAIEQNTLSVEQVTAVLNGKRVLGLPQEIQEVRNAFTAYEALSQLQPERLEDLLQAHGLLMLGLTDDAGCFRHGGVGVYRGKELVHMAPPAGQVPRLMSDLHEWLVTTDLHPLIASCAYHYELEFIHPFSDGNGRIGRLWQTAILSHWQPLLAYLPVETVIKARQDEYYQLLGDADEMADCTDFIVFLLDAIRSALQEALTKSAETLVETLVETPVEKGAVNLPKTPELLLALLSEHPNWTLAQAATALGKSTSAIERAAANLKKQGRLCFVGPRKAGRWEVSGT